MEGLIFGILRYFKIRLGGSEICLPDVNMHYNLLLSRIIAKKCFPRDTI